MNTLQLATPPPLLPQAVADRLFSRILLAIDFGSASLGAARWATTHVAARAEAVLMHVLAHDEEPLCVDAHRIGDDDSPSRMTPALTGGLGGFGATLEVASARNVVHVGRPSSCLAAMANDAEASLVVLGRRAAANRICIGEPNVIERVARRTSASVLVVPEGTTNTPERVVAAVDDSRFAPLVLRVAGKLARLHEIPLTVLHVLSPTSRSPQKTRWLEQLGRAHDSGGRDATEVATGVPAREIARTATARDGALVVIGMRGADEAPPGSIGSVARELFTRAPVPVLALNAI